MLKYNIGEAMINQNNIEAIYDCLDQCAMKLYETSKTPYLKGIMMTSELIVTGEIDDSIDINLLKELKSQVSSIEGITFDKEEIRKAMQLCILKGFKHIKANNQEMTPDTIGIFVSYLLNKFFPDDKPLLMIDPLVGTGNLLTTVANHLKTNVQIVGVENQVNQYNLAKAMFELMDYGDELYFQDTLTFFNLSADVVLMDFSYVEANVSFFPYEVIKHHYQNLNKDGILIAIIYNDFFENEFSDAFRKEMIQLYDVLGLIKLPDSLFKDLGKSIFILQKKNDKIAYEEKQFLLADIPSFEDEEAFGYALKKINQWFDNRKKS